MTMQWNSFDEFWQMGGYGFYVWGSYAVTFALLAGEALLVMRRRRRALAAVQRSSGVSA